MVKIYYLHNGDNIPFYVGETSVQLNSRNAHHKQKYGTTTQIELVDEVENDEWRFWEEHYISLFRSWGFNLKNKNKGGGGCEKGTKKHTPESIEKLKKARVGFFHSEETKQKQSKSNMGISRNKGNKYALNHTVSPDSRKSIGEKRKRKIDQYSKNGEFIKTWPSIKEAGESLNIQKSDITNCCLGYNKTAGGYIWKHHNS